MGLPSRPRPRGRGRAGTAKSSNKSLQFVACELSIKPLDWQTLPENIPPAEHIKDVEKRIKQAAPKLTLDEREAGGLLGEEKKP